MFFTIQFNIYTQEKISFTVLQDASLLVFGDHHRENAKTLDLLINIKIQGKPSQFGYFVIFPEYEKASLDKLYQRFSLNFGYTFNDIYIRNFIEPRKFEFTLAIGFGVINRFSNNSFSFSSLTYNIDEDNIDEEEKESNPLYNKLVPLEVANYYCKEYFDDEDFIFMTLEIPYDLMDEIMESGNNTITEYFESFMNNVEISDDDIKEQMYYQIYNNCVTVYDKILEYIMPSWYGNDIPNDPSDYSIFNNEWTNVCRCFLSQVKEVLESGMNDESIEYLCTYNKEVYAGLFIILSRLENLFSYYHDKCSLNEFVDELKDYRSISVRLINNICVILLYLRFYYLNNPITDKKENKPNIDSMITMED